MIDFSVIALTVLGWLMALQAQFLIGFLAGFSVLSYNAEEKSKSKFLYGLISVFASLPALAYLLIPFFAKRAGVDADASATYFTLWAACVGISIVGAFWWLRHGVGTFDVVTSKLTKSTSLERDKKTDVREMDKHLPPEIGSYSPEKYSDFKKGIFTGLDSEKNPVYIDQKTYQNSNLLLSGRTRSGKGIAAQILLSQSIHLGEFVVILDPKRDNWMPHIFKAACEKAGKKYNFLDLNQSAPVQTNLFWGCDAETIENMLIGGFSLGEKGGDSDFYKLSDRRCARECAKWLADNQGKTARDALVEFGEAWADPKMGAPAFHSYMCEIAEIPAINAPGGTGIDIASGEREGGCLYVVGDMINTRVIRLQRMILLRLLFLAKNRDYLEQEPRLIRVLADEFKAHISRPIITSLGITLGFRLSIIVATQSFLDFCDVPADLDKDLVRGSCLENCAIKLSYSITDPDTRDILCSMTGIILVDDETKNVQRNMGLAEVVENKRSIRQAERFLVDSNMMSMLPVGCGVLNIAGKLSRYCYTSPVKAQRSRDSIQPTAVEAAGDMNMSVAASMINIPDTLDEVEQENPFAIPAQSESSDVQDVD